MRKAKQIDLSSMGETQLELLIRGAQNRLALLHAAKRDVVKAKLEKLLKTEGVSLEELYSDRASPGGARQHLQMHRRSLPALYQNPQDRSRTWSGKGRRPQWYVEAIADGKKPQDLMIKRMASPPPPSSSPDADVAALERRADSQKKSAARLQDAATRKPSKRAKKRAAAARTRANVSGSKASKARLERDLPPAKKAAAPRKRM